MNAFATSSLGPTALRPREADGWRAGFMLAVGAHLLLVIALALGVQWKMHDEAPIEAEVWAEIPEAAAPPLAPPPPAEPEVTPQPEPETVKAPEPEPEPEVVPEVVVAKAPPKKEEPKKKAKEPREVFETAPPKVKAKPEPKEDKKKDEKKPEKPPEKAVAKQAPVPSKVTAPDGAGMSAVEREALRKANLQRMMADLGGQGSLGTSSRSAGPSAAYGARIRARIKPNIVFTDNVNGNPLAVVEVRCAPDGRIMSRRLLTPSGVPSWDDAVLRAVDRTEVLPANEEGRVPAVMQLEFKPKDF